MPRSSRYIALVPWKGRRLTFMELVIRTDDPKGGECRVTWRCKVDDQLRDQPKDENRSN